MRRIGKLAASCLSALSLVLSFCLDVYAAPTPADGHPTQITAIPEARQLWLPLVFGSGLFNVLPARPRDIEVTLDAARAVSSTVSEAGGVLQTVDAGGAHFTLVLPPQALIMTTTVTMTPIQAVMGLASGVGFVAGVHLEPEGQRLFQLATLTISPTVTLPVTREMSFTSAAGGQNAHTYPLDIQPRTPTFTVGHFSEYGLSEVEPLTPMPDFDSVPVGDEAQFESALRDLLSTERTRQLSGVTPDPGFLDKFER